jgi:hypothetical protein
MVVFAAGECRTAGFSILLPLISVDAVFLHSRTVCEQTGQEKEIVHYRNSKKPENTVTMAV